MISIIIPVYNQPKELNQCLSSIKNQTYENYEIILVNDRSTTSLSRVLKKYKKIFGYKIDFINNQINHGAAYTRNKGYRRSKGEYLLFCDADVVMKPEMLAKMLDTLKEHPEASYVFSSHWFGRKKFRLWKFDPERLRKMPYIHTTSLIKRKHFPKFDENIKRFQDWDLWLTMLREGHIGIWLDNYLFKVIPGGTMSSWLPSFAYKIFPFLPKARKYSHAVSIIKAKHDLL